MRLRILRTLFGEVVDRFGHFLEIVLAGISLETDAFSCSHLRFNINQQIERTRRLLIRFFLFGCVLPFTCDDSLDLGFRVSIAQGAQPDTLLLVMAGKRNICALFYYIAFSLHERKKSFKRFRFTSQCRINCAAQLLTVRRFCLFTEPFVVAVPRMTFRIFDDGVPMCSKADHVAELCHGSTGTEKIPELVPTINRRGIPNDVIMNVVFIYVSADQESVLSFQKPRGKFIAEFVRVFRRDLSRAERLAHLICDDVNFLFSSGNGFILPFGKKKFGVGSVRITPV
jgi:hypothetical protein